MRRAPSAALLLVAIAAVAVNLRLSVTALGALLPEIREDLHLSGAAAGLLNSLPTFVFAFAGIAVPAVAARVGTHRLVLFALLVAGSGQLLRAFGDTTLTLFAGTLATLVGLAVGNVMLPGLVRQHFPDKITAVTALYVTTLSLGATVGSAATIPIQQGLDGDWHTGLFVWAGVALAASLPWVVVALRSHDGNTDKVRSSVPVKSLVRTRLAWAMAGFFGLQSAHAYVGLGWLSQVFLDAGIGEVTMGFLLAVTPAVGIPLSLLVPVLMRTQSRIGPMILTFCTCFAAGYLGLVLAPAAGAWAWVFLIGVGSSTFPLALTLVALRARTSDGVIALSAFTQCVGYLLAALGPLLFGLLHDATGSWDPSLTMMAISVVPLAIVGLRVARVRYLEDELSPRG